MKVFFTLLFTVPNDEDRFHKLSLTQIYLAYHISMNKYWIKNIGMKNYMQEFIAMNG